MSALSIGIGETLRTARRRQGHALSDVAASTRVRESYLAALESEEFEALGNDVYARGFLTAYARFLGLDPEPLLSAHRDYRNGQGPAAGHRRSARPAGVGVRSLRVAVLLLLALVVVAALVVTGLAGDELAWRGWP